MKLPELPVSRLAPSRAGTDRERFAVGGVRARVVLVLVALLVLVMGGIAFGLLAGAGERSSSAPTGADGDGGIPVISGRDATSSSAKPMVLTVYTDYSSHDAATFLTVNDLFVRGLLDAGSATVAIHPIVAPELSGGDDEYALRAANAAVCVAEYASGSFWEFHVALFANQPSGPVNTASDEDLIDLAAGSGVDRMGEVSACIRDGTFASWVQDRSTEASAPGGVVDRIPVVLADGRVYDGSISSNTEFRAFLASVSTAN